VKSACSLGRNYWIDDDSRGAEVEGKLEEIVEIMMERQSDS
jgi:hypothetical protein